MEVDESAGVARPTAKQELADLKAKYSSNQQLAYDCYNDPMLQMELKILFLGAYFLMKEYTATLESQKAGKDGNRGGSVRFSSQ